MLAAPRPVCTYEKEEEFWDDEFPEIGGVPTGFAFVAVGDGTGGGTPRAIVECFRYSSKRDTSPSHGTLLTTRLLLLRSLRDC